MSMKYTLAAVAVVACIAGGALAQTTPPAAAPAAPVPASSCPAYPAPPALPDASTLRTVKQVDAGTTTVNTWRNSYQAVHDCRLAEINALKPKVTELNTRVEEARSGQQVALDTVAKWQGSIDAFTASKQKKKK
jgi:hypothetical protein